MTAVAAVAAVTAPSAAGDYAVSVTVVDDSYSGTASATLTVGSVTIDNTAATYTSAAQAPPVTLVPSDLTHTVTYTNSAGTAVTSPTKADTYTVLVTVSDTRYPSDTSASYTINTAALTADLGDLSTVYGLGAPSSADWAATLTYSGFVGAETASTDAVAAVAAVAAVDAVAEVLYVTGDTLPAGKAVGDVKTAAVAAVTAVAAVAAVPAVVTTGLTVSYDKAVSDAGSYVATPAGLSSSNYAITYSVGALTVTKMGTTIALTNTSQGYTSSVLAVTATPAIDGLTVDVVYKEENSDNTFSVVESPTAQGTYYVTATINDTNHSGSATGTLTITKADTALTLADLPDVVFSATPITAVATADAGRTVTYFVTGAATASGNVITLLNSGTVQVEAYVAETDDYGYAYVVKTFTVTKAPTSVTLAGGTVVYNGLGQSVTASVADSGGASLAPAVAAVDAVAEVLYVTGDTLPDGKAVGDVKTAAVVAVAAVAATVGVDIVYTDAAGAAVASPTVVGDYTVTATVNDTKYGGSVTGTLRILKAPLTITADDQTKEYLQANPTLTLTYTGFQNSEDASVLSTQATVGTGADASSSLGEYGIVVYGAAAANYAITHVDGALTVEKNTIGITLTGTSVTYTGSAFAVTATPSVADVSVVVTYADAAGAAVASPTNAGTYTVTATADSTLYQATQTGTLTIAKATATVTLSDLAATYNGSAKLAAATTVPAGLTVDLTYSQGSTLVAPITAVTAVDAVAAVLYTAADDTDTATAGVQLADGTTVSVGDVKTAAVAVVTAVTGVTGPSNAGTYAIVGSVNEVNYSGYITGDLVIAKKALSATADALAKTYGSANPAATITYSGFENSEDATVLDTAPAATIGADATSGVGDYDITLSAGTDNNYEITTANGKLTVGKAVVAVTAADVTKIYGAAVDEFSFEAYGDAVEAVSGTATVRIYANDGDTYGGVDTGATGGTGYGAKKPGTLLYTSDAITLKDGYQTYKATGIEGINLSDKVTWTVEFSAGSTAGLVLGGTDVVGSSLNDFWQKDSAGWTLYQTDSGSEGADFAAKLTTDATVLYHSQSATYEVYYSAGTEFGDEINLAAIGFTSTGYVNGDDIDDIDTKPTVSTAATASSDVGTYALTAAGGADDNYSFAYTGGVLTISKITATIALSDNTVDYDGKAHGVTVTTTPAGLEGSVTVKYDGSTSVPVFVGSYAVTASMDGTNYSAAAVTDTLTISQGSAKYVALADLPDVFYGDPPLDLGLSASTGKRVMVFISGPAELSDDAARLVTINNVGTVDILVYALDETIPIEYRIQGASFEVKKRNLLITADSQDRAYGSENPALTYTIQGFAPGEGESVFSTAPVLTTTATSASTVGNIAITFATEAVDGTGRYAISHQPGTLTVSKAPLTITAVSQTRIYGAGNPDSLTLPQGLLVREYHDIGGTQVGDLTGNAKYPTGYDFQAVAGYFEWPQSGDINTKPAGNVRDNYGVTMEGYITPTETASYEFYLAADDHAELWLSTDSDPANLVKIANEPQWNGVRSFAGTDRRTKADTDKFSVIGSASVDAVAEVLYVTGDTLPDGAAVGDVKTAAVAAVAAVNDAAALATALAAEINANSSDTSAKVTATAAAGVVTITAAEANDAITITTDLSFTPPTPTTAVGSIAVRQYQGISGGLDDFINDAKFPDSPDFEETVGYLEWPQSGDINVKPAGNVQDNYGVQLKGFLHPPTTDDYQFAIASDDNSQLWLSTDADPANRVLIAQETGWQPIRKYQPVGDEATSGFISLEAGKAYYIEVLNKEGGGGDNVAVAWTTGDAIVPDALPISGAYLSPWVRTGDAASVVLTTTTAGAPAVAGVDAVAVVLYTAADDTDTAIAGVQLADGTTVSVGDVKTAAVVAVAAVAAKAQVTTLTIGGTIAVGDKVSLTVTGTRLETTSLPIALAAGTSYYVRALMKEGGGGDNLAVAWIKSGEAAPANDALPIPGSVLTPANSINYTYAGFVNNEGTSALISLPSGSIDASTTTSTGDVDITIAGADAANYDVTHVNGKLTIAPAALTISAVNKEVLETVAIPDFTYTVSGFLNGEDSSVVTTAPSLTTDADNTVPGDYAIVPSGAVATNYAVNYVNGNLKVNTLSKPKVSSLVVSNNAPSVGAKVTLTATATGDLITYEWYFGKDLIQGETSNTLVIEDIGLDQSGRYSVFAENLRGKARKLAKITVSERANEVFLVVGENSSTVSAEGLIAKWDFNDTSDPAGSVDSVASIKGVFAGGAKYATGRTGAGSALDVNGSATAAMLVEEGGFI